MIHKTLAETPASTIINFLHYSGIPYEKLDYVARGPIPVCAILLSNLNLPARLCRPHCGDVLPARLFTHTTAMSCPSGSAAHTTAVSGARGSSAHTTAMSCPSGSSAHTTTMSCPSGSAARTAVSLRLTGTVPNRTAFPRLRRRWGRVASWNPALDNTSFKALTPKSAC